jgi:MFS family permease
VLQAAALCWIAAFLLFWALTITPHPLLAAALLAAIAAFTLAGMLQGPTINAIVVDLAPANAPGRHLAAFQLSWSLGQAAAPPLLLWLLSRGAQWPWIALIAARYLVPARVLLGLVAAAAAPFYRLGPHPHATCTATVARGPGGIPVGPGAGGCQVLYRVLAGAAFAVAERLRK